jgi:hypothetical protein
VILDFIHGAGTILIIMVVAGGIAYVGDRVGHQVGRRRLTLFGIRPRYTSTIVAVGTGMLIAFTVTVVAILASRQVQTAFFKLNRINAEISTLQAREQELESKVNTGQLVVPVDSLMVPYFAIIPKGDSVENRLKRIEAFYRESVQFINANYPPRGLRRYVVPPDINRKLAQDYGTPAVTMASAQSNVLLVITAGQNLYRSDAIHFELNMISDTQRIAKGGVVASLVIPGGKNANANLAVNELQQIVSNIARSQLQLPPFLSNNVQVVDAYPALAQMQAMLAKGPANYVMTAFAATNIYPHTGGVPVVVALTQSK